MKNKTKWIIFLLLVVGSAIAYVLWKKNKSFTISYRNVPVARGDIEVMILSNGTVAPENRVEIKPPVAGRIERVIADEGQVVKKGQILAWMSSTERAALLDSARARGEAEVARWEEFYKATPILAPISGTIIVRNVETGQTFTNADSVYSMSDRLTIKAQVDESDLAQIRVKQPAQIILDAYGSEKIPAVVDRIAFDAKIVNNVTTYVVDVLPNKTPAFMRSGMTANVSFVSDAKIGVLRLPVEAVKSEGKRSSVLIADSNQKNDTSRKEIKTGITDGKFVEIVSGLNEGDEVLVPQLQSKTKTLSSPFSPMGGRRR